MCPHIQNRFCYFIVLFFNLFIFLFIYLLFTDYYLLNSDLNFRAEFRGRMGSRYGLCSVHYNSGAYCRGGCCVQAKQVR